MATPRERIRQIYDNYTATRVVFKPFFHDDKFALVASVVKSLAIAPSEDPLQDALVDHIDERWDSAQCRYYIGNDVQGCYDSIKHDIVRAYDKYSVKSGATRRKTISFIYDVQLDAKYIPNYFLSIFIELQKEEWELKTELEKQKFFEPLESLRKTYGKR